MIYSIVVALIIFYGYVKYQKQRDKKRADVAALQQIQRDWKPLEELERIPHY